MDVVCRPVKWQSLFKVANDNDPESIHAVRNGRVFFLYKV